MGVTLTHDVTGRPLPLEELGDDWLHAMGPHLPRLTLAVQQCWKNTGMLAAVANCGRSQKWCSRGRLVLGFKPRCSSHVASFWDHVAWAEKNHGLLFLFLRYGTPDGQRGKEGLCTSVGILRDFGISMKTLSHYS